MCGTPNYIAPEILYDQGEGHSFEVDIWSVGVILYTLLVGRPPFQTSNVQKIYDRIRRNEYEIPPEANLSPESKELIRQILSQRPSERPSLQEIMHHPWFQAGTVPLSVPSSAVYHQPYIPTLSDAESRRNFEELKTRAHWQSEEQEAAALARTPPRSARQEMCALEAAEEDRDRIDRESQRAIDPGSPISTLLKVGRQPLMRVPQATGGSLASRMQDMQLQDKAPQRAVPRRPLTAMELTEVPESLLVLGGGYVALEQAQLFARLGSQVTLLVRSRLASKEEPEVSKALQEVFADEGIRVVSRAVPTRVSRGTGGEAVVTAALSGGSQEFRADQVLVALGRRPVTDGLNLDAVGVKTGGSGEVVVSDRLQSSNPRIWAAGDVTGHPEFVYVAAHHGTLVAENAFADADRSVDYARLPRVTFTGPAIGAVGMTEKEVLAAGIRCDCRVLPLHHVPRALVNRDTRGFIKIVVNAETNEILGLTAVAKDAGELAAAGVHVLGRTVAEVADAWAPYLTMAEGIRIAAKAFTTDPSLLSCCA